MMQHAKLDTFMLRILSDIDGNFGAVLPKLPPRTTMAISLIRESKISLNSVASPPQSIT